MPGAARPVSVPGMRIKLTTLFVDDQERARAFYTDVLGFQVKVDAAYGDSGRWLSVVPPDVPDATELLLEAPDEHARTFQRAVRDAGKPWTTLDTEDCQADFERLRAKGVSFTLEPTRMPYGGTDAVFDDGCGNLICLHQD
jgi:catechol 2,3-dioxygenase-like lactoylglutathione lyase family enzyme